MGSLKPIYGALFYFYYTMHFVKHNAADLAILVSNILHRSICMTWVNHQPLQLIGYQVVICCYYNYSFKDKIF